MDVEAHLLLQETLLRDVLFESTAALLVVDDEMRILVANRAAAELSGYTLAELAKLPAWEITGDPKRSAANAARVHAEGRLASTSRLRRKDGSIVPCQYFAWEVAASGLPFIAILLWPDGG